MLSWLLLLAAIVAVRTFDLGADPAADMPEANPMDEGLWADGARGQFLFGDWFADDTGNAILIAPLHSLLLLVAYEGFGIGLWQTRLVPAICGILLCVLIGTFVGRRLGRRAGAITASLLAVCPLLDQHSRTGLLESEQLLWMALAFCAIADRAASWPRALLAGAALACAGATKPNALTLGAVPVALVFLDQWYRAWRDGSPGTHARHLRAAAGLIGAGTIVLLPFLLLIWGPHLVAWQESVYAESGADEWRLGDHLLRLGLAFGRETEPGVHRLWSTLRNAPAIAFGFWAWCLARGTRSWLPGERAFAIWAFATLLLTEADYMHVGRRQLLMLPAFAGLAVFQLCSARVVIAAEPRRSRRIGWWLLLSLPMVLLVRPIVVNWMNERLHGTPATSYLISLLLLFAWLVAAVAIGRFLPDPSPWRARLLRLAPIAMLLLAVSNAPRLSALSPSHHTILDAQHTLRARVAPGEVVLGQHASLLFLDAPVRTVRRTLLEEFYATPRANPDAFARLQPRYLLDYRDADLREFADLPTDAYQEAAAIDYLREDDGRYRYRLVLRQRP